jgi:hypothetical protein
MKVCKSGSWMELTQYLIQWLSFALAAMNSLVIITKQLVYSFQIIYTEVNSDTLFVMKTYGVVEVYEWLHHSLPRH